MKCFVCFLQLCALCIFLFQSSPLASCIQKNPIVAELKISKCEVLDAEKLLFKSDQKTKKEFEGVFLDVLLSKTKEVSYREAEVASKAGLLDSAELTKKRVFYKTSLKNPCQMYPAGKIIHGVLYPWCDDLKIQGTPSMLRFSYYLNDMPQSIKIKKAKKTYVDTYSLILDYAGKINRGDIPYSVSSLYLEKELKERAYKFLSDCLKRGYSEESILQAYLLFKDYGSALKIAGKIKDKESLIRVNRHICEKYAQEGEYENAFKMLVKFSDKIDKNSLLGFAGTTRAKAFEDILKTFKKNDASIEKINALMKKYKKDIPGNTGNLFVFYSEKQKHEEALYYFDRFNDYHYPGWRKNEKLGNRLRAVRAIYLMRVEFEKYLKSKNKKVLDRQIKNLLKEFDRASNPMFPIEMRFETARRFRQAELRKDSDKLKGQALKNLGDLKEITFTTMLKPLAREYYNHFSECDQMISDIEPYFAKRKQKLYRAVAQECAKEGLYDKALKIAQKIEEKDRKNAVVWSVLRSMIRDSKPLDAEKLLKQTDFKRHKTSWYMSIAKAYIEKNMPEKALTLARDIPKEVKKYNLISEAAIAFQEKGEVKKTISLMWEVIENILKNEKIYTKADSSFDFFSIIKNIVKLKDNKELLKILDKIIKIAMKQGPYQRTDSLRLISRAYADAGNPDKAVGLLSLVGSDIDKVRLLTVIDASLVKNKISLNANSKKILEDLSAKL